MLPLPTATRPRAGPLGARCPLTSRSGRCAGPDPRSVTSSPTRCWLWASPLGQSTSASRGPFFLGSHHRRWEHPGGHCPLLWVWLKLSHLAPLSGWGCCGDLGLLLPQASRLRLRRGCGPGRGQSWAASPAQRTGSAPHPPHSRPGSGRRPRQHAYKGSRCHSVLEPLTNVSSAALWEWRLNLTRCSTERLHSAQTKFYTLASTHYPLQ